MASTVNDISVDYYDEAGTQLVKELDKKILSKGSWATIMFQYQDLDKASGNFKPAKITLRRFQKINGEYRLKSKFNISSNEQASLILETLNSWLDAK